MDQLLRFINNLNAAQRAVIVGGFSLLFVFLIGLLIYSNIKANDAKLNYTIATGLTKNQIMLASNELEASGIPFSIIGNGNNLTLKTNKDNINIAKIKLITSQSISSKHTGWEIFDKSSLGTTNFENNVKLLRATEGELARSLESLTGVLSASVKIAIPKESVFTQRKTLPTASAVLNLRPGIALTQKQINGVKSFISSSVPKLIPDNIKLIDQNGALLEKDQESIDNLKYISHEKYKKKLEADYEDKIKTLLEPFIGNNRVVARVTVTLDFKKQMIEQEIFEPEGTIRSQQTTESTSSKEEKAKDTAAVPGVQSNIQNPDEADGETKSKANSEEAKNIVNYEISKKIIKEKDNSFARVANIKAAVTFDSTILDSVENKEEFLNNLSSIVQDGIGIDVNRGDKVSVQPFKFIQVDQNVTNLAGLDDGTLAPVAVKSLMQEYGEYIQYIIAALLLFIFYKRFIANNGIVLATEGEGKKEQVGVADEDFDYTPFNQKIEQNKLKSRIRNEILQNIDGMDGETAAQYEVLVEELDNQINNHPDEIAKMIELLLSEGDKKLKSKKGDE
jgi:flagellar M-ring protein FliF